MGYKPTTRIDGIFDDLVVRYGWGMYGDSSALRAEPPDDIERFIDELLAIDGQSPELATREDRRLLRRIVNDWVFDISGRGAKSGLPLKEPS
ncbi:MAG: hypothetical protein ABIQ73_05315 [Acidimicrobiales bacterium]